MKPREEEMHPCHRENQEAKAARLTLAIEDLLQGVEAEVIMPADTYYKVLSKKSSGGNTHIELEEVLPFGKKMKKAA